MDFKLHSVDTNQDLLYELRLNHMILVDTITFNISCQHLSTKIIKEPAQISRNSMESFCFFFFVDQMLDFETNFY